MKIPCLLLLCASLTASAQTATAPPPVQDATPLSYELVSIHKAKLDETHGYGTNNTPNGLNASAISVRQLISEAFGFTFGELLDEQITGLPGWAQTQRFDIQAKVDDSNVGRLKAARDADTMAVWVKAMVERKPTTDTALLQKLVTDNFHLQMHYEQRTMPVFAMTLAKGGVKMASAHPADPEKGSMSFSNGKLSGENVPADFIPFVLIHEVGQPVVNRTGLPGRYDFAMTFTPQAGMTKSDASSDAPSVFTALEEQLGIKLVHAKEPVWVIVVDHVDMPEDN